MSIYGPRVERFRYDLLDLENQKVDELRVSTAAAGSLDLSTQATPQGSGSATITPVSTVDWLKQRVRVWYLTDDGTEQPLITAIPKVPADTYSATSLTQAVQLFDCTEAVNSDRYGYTYSLPAGTNIIAAAAAVVASTGEAGAVFEPSAQVLASAMVWDTSATKLQIVNDLLAAANYFALYADPLGRLRGIPYTAPASRPTKWAFSGGQDNLYTPDWTREADLYSVPNRYVCVSQALDDGTVWVATATDNDPASRFSFASRGRWITPAPATDVVADSQATLAAIAQRKLTEAQQVAATYTIRHPWLPFTLNDVVEAYFPRSGEQVRASVQRQTISLTAGGLVRSTILGVDPS